MFTNNQIFAAPLAGITDRPFRTMVRKFSLDVPLVTEMISCHSLVQMRRGCIRNFDNYRDEVGPIGAQIFGAEPDIMANAARILADNGASWIDINMGCPVPKVATRAGAGAHLMRDHILAGKIISAVVHAVDIPVSIKTRLGWDDDHRDWLDLMHVAHDSGARFATLHGRTRAQLYVGPAQLLQIPSDCPLPIIANGDIANVAHVTDALGRGYAGAMVGRAMLGAPWILGVICGAAKRPENVGEIVLEHLENTLEYYGVQAGIPLFRKHAAWYSAGIANSSEFRIRVNSITDAGALKKTISEFWGCVDA